jgi:molybdopterin molybdotransferase
MSKPLLPIDDALALVLQHTKPLATERVPLTEALGRVLAVNACADQDLPGFDRAAMDGIALRAVDARAGQPGQGAWLRVLGESAAGRPFDGELVPGACVRIMTGAVVPPGADAVVPVERIVREADGFRLQDDVRPEQHVARRGSEVRRGEVVVPAGVRLNGARLGVLATFGHAEVDVVRRPVVAVLPTGDEIVPVTVTPGPGQVRDANRHAITGLLREAGAVVRQLPVAPDDRAQLRALVAEAFDEADVVVLSGGVSAGEYDLVPPVLAELGATAHCHQIAIKPGKPFLFATRGPQLAFGLPGNPISSYVCCAMFVLPALAALQGQTGVHRQPLRWHGLSVPADHATPGAGPRAEVVPAVLREGRADVLPVKGSADLAHFAAGEWLVLRRAGDASAVEGDPLEILLWPRP